LQKCVPSLHLHMMLRGRDKRTPHLDSVAQVFNCGRVARELQLIRIYKGRRRVVSTAAASDAVPSGVCRVCLHPRVLLSARAEGLWCMDSCCESSRPADRPAEWAHFVLFTFLVVTSRTSAGGLSLASDFPRAAEPTLTEISVEN
jgi:hypothetical protein